MDFASTSRDRRRLRAGLVPLAACVLASFPAAAGAAVASFAKGRISIGVHGGLAVLAMRDVNDVIGLINRDTGARFDEFGLAWEGVADARYAITDRVFLGLEGGYLRATSENANGPGRLEVSGVPILITGGASATTEGNLGFRFIGGLGALVDGRFGDEAGNELSGTAFLLAVGAEGEWRVSPGFAVTAQGLARQAKVERPERALYDLDFSGGSFRLGLRGYLGGGR